MRGILTEHLAIAEQGGASPEMVEQIRDELRHYGG